MFFFLSFISPTNVASQTHREEACSGGQQEEPLPVGMGVLRCPDAFDHQLHVELVLGQAVGRQGPVVGGQVPADGQRRGQEELLQVLRGRPARLVCGHNLQGPTTGQRGWEVTEQCLMY